eukprot:jgi/Chrzof1/9543/Cz04g07080.t1
MRQPTYKDAATQIALLLIVVSVQVLGAAAAPPTYAQQLAVQQQAAYQAQLQAQQQAAYQAQLQAQQQAQLAAQQQAAGVVAQPAAAAAQAAVAVPAPAVAAPAPAVAPPAPAVAAPAPALAVPAPAVAQPAVATTAAAVPAPKPAAPAPTAAPTPKPVPSPPPPPPPPAPPGMIPRSFLQGTIPANKTALPVIRVPEGTKIKLTWVCDIAGNLYVGAGKEELIQCPSANTISLSKLLGIKGAKDVNCPSNKAACPGNKAVIQKWPFANTEEEWNAKSATFRKALSEAASVSLDMVVVTDVQLLYTKPSPSPTPSEGKPPATSKRPETSKAADKKNGSFLTEAAAAPLRRLSQDKEEAADTVATIEEVPKGPKPKLIVSVLMCSSDMQAINNDSLLPRVAGADPCI